MTFTAGFTLRAGVFESDKKGGMIILLTRRAFHTFVVSDIIALTFSVFVYFYIATITISELQVIVQLYNNATLLQLLLMSAGVVSLATGMYATLSHSLGLVVTVCVISVISYYLVCYMILLPKTRSTENHLNRSII